LLGIDGLVFVGHGRSDARAITSALILANSAIKNNLLEHLQADIAKNLSN
jgi:glycerol-3-phosphate acyltransferase PlsX